VRAAAVLALLSLLLPLLTVCPCRPPVADASHACCASDELRLGPRDCCSAHSDRATVATPALGAAAPPSASAPSPVAPLLIASAPAAPSPVAPAAPPPLVLRV